MHPRKTCCLADVRTSNPGITPLYWRAERSEWGAAGRDQLMIWAQKFAVSVVVLGTGYKAAAFREVVCPLRRTSRSECVKNTLIGRETEHHQSDGSRVVALLAFAPSNKEDKESFADLRGQVIHAHQTLLTSAVGIC